MQAISKILVSTVLVTGFVVTSHAGELVQADEGRSFKQIAACLEKFGLHEDEDFRKNPKTKRIQFREGVFDDGFYRSKRAEIDMCWKNSE